MTDAALPQQTLANPVSLAGIGLHSGQTVQVRLEPRDHVGLVFQRSDLSEAAPLDAALRRVAGTTHATTLAQGDVTISTTEHLLAALWACDITACTIVLDGPEVPILDGSAAGWCELLSTAGTAALAATRPLYRLRQPVWVTDGHASVLGLPHPSFRLTAAVSYDVAYMPPQVFDLELTANSFRRELAPARTFTLESWIEPLRAQGLIRGGSTENAIVLGEAGPSSPLRFEDELARHKALDVVGDFALLCAADGGILQAHIIATYAGHALHRRWMEAAAPHLDVNNS